MIRITRENEISNGLLDFFKDTQQEMQDIEMFDMQEITAGWETELFAFTLKYSENEIVKQKKLVIRMYPGEFAERSLTYELHIYTNLSKQNYPIPKIHYSSKNKQYVGKPFLIMDWLVGGVLDTKWETDLEGTIKLFCQLFVDLHNLDWKPFINETPLSYTTNFHLDLVERRMARNNLDELIPIVKWLKTERKRIKEELLAIGHFDFHTFNILLDEYGKPFVIDWPSAHVGDFRFDLGWSLVLYRVYTNQENRDAVFQMYQQISGKEINNIDFFEVAAIARRLSDVLITFKSESRSNELNPQIRQNIKDTIFHVENLNSYLEELTNLRIKEIDELI
ncbi:MAG: aminoglycoside phosphotransferase family protein, partial [Asgard group archaeon]|nr:aminoglycoside phosphotransferase family protein [Asgard group archaeon]